MSKFRFTCLLLFAGLSVRIADAQPVPSGKTRVADGIAAVVGENIITRSELENEYYQAAKQMGNTPDLKCQVMDRLLVNKLLLQFAQLDSLPLADDRVEAEIDNKLRFYARQIGSEQRLEEYLGKPLAQYKKEMKPRVREQMLIKQMEDKVLGSVKVSPREVKAFFDTIPQDSLPLVGLEVELAQLVMKPQVSEDAKMFAREKLEGLRQRILSGEDFHKLARIYSEDPGSGRDGGRLPEFGRGDMVGPFERASFKLKPDSVSGIIETDFGFHVIKLLKRRGERILAAHILIRPLITNSDLSDAKNRMDSIYEQLVMDSLDFCTAVQKFSSDKASKGECGFYQDENTGLQRVAMESLDQGTVKSIEKLEPGEYSKPEFYTDEEGATALRIFYLKSQIQPHRPNLNQDYQRIQILATQARKQSELQKWVEQKRREVFIQVNSDYLDCDIFTDWNNTGQ